MNWILLIKILIFIAILVAAYFIMNYYEINPFEAISEAVSEIEFNVTALVLTLLISIVLWLTIWKGPFWVNNVCHSFFCITGTPMKVFLTIFGPVVGYPFAVRALNKDY